MDTISRELPMVELQFDCIEQSANVIRIGLHYDKEYKAALLLNLSLSNVLLNHSKVGAELAIGDNPAFSLSLFHSPSIHPIGKNLLKSKLAPDWLFNFNGYQYDAYNYSGNQRIAAYTYTNLSTGFQLLFSPSINSATGAGIIGDYSVVNTKIGSDIEEVKSYYMYLTYRLFYERDNYNEDYFPTRGYKFRLEGNYHTGLSENVRYSDGLFGVIFRSSFACPMTQRWTMHTGIDLGSIFGSNVPQQYLMCIGGEPGKHLRYDMSFVGMHFLQECNKNAWVIHLNNQIRLWNNIYLTFRANMGKTNNDVADLIIFKDLRIGYGVSAQYNSVIGPLGFTVASSNLTKSPLTAVNFGYWF
jgi:NTE family protein